ncbi:hypothetical protein [Streptomyces sp. NPDC058424]|uniref:hypothetical protein n=1 Tax=Streptomyces sp. NPDC058424 TaxID=3346491 RepID=UPI00365A12BF
MEKGKTGPADWAMRVVLWLYALVSIPLYLWFLHHMDDRWGQQLPADDDLRFWLPIVVPLAAFSFITISSTSRPGGGAPRTTRSSWATSTGGS